MDFYSDGNHKAFNKYYLRDFYTIHKLIEHSYSRVLLFQTNNEFYHLRHLLDQYPGAKAIIVFRHYADVVNSTLRNEWKWVKGQVVFNLRLFKLLFENGGHQSFFDYLDDNRESQLTLDPGNWTRLTNPSSMLDGLFGESVYYAVHWLLSAKFALDNNLVNDERVILVSYEKMVTTPEVYLKKICQFLGLDYHSYMISGIHSKSVGKNKPVDLPGSLDAACKDTFDELCNFENMRMRGYAEYRHC